MDIDAIILLGVALVAIAFVFVVVKLVRNNIRKKKEQREAIQKRLDSLRDDSWKKVSRANSVPLKSSKPAVAPIKTSYSAPAPTSTTSSDDSFVNGMLTGMLIDNVVDSLTHRSEPSVGVTKSESSWGFDDSDSKKSISDSMSSSWSDSSSSSDSWSSSDSGPSSDW